MAVPPLLVGSLKKDTAFDTKYSSTPFCGCKKGKQTVQATMLVTMPASPSSMVSDTSIDSIIADERFEIISTLAYSYGLPPNPTDPEAAPHCYLLQYAIDRLIAAAEEFQWKQVISYLNQPSTAKTLVQEIDHHMQNEYADACAEDRLFIIRIAFREDASFTLMSGERPNLPEIPRYPNALPSPYERASRKIPMIDVFVDKDTMQPSAFTRHKTTYRDTYTDARARVGLCSATPFRDGEVLLINDEGEVMDGGFTTVYFWRQDESGEWGWRTPRQESGTKLGVSRRWALEHAGVTEMAITAKEVVEGEKIWMSSAVAGFVRGKVSFERQKML